MDSDPQDPSVPKSPASPETAVPVDSLVGTLISDRYRIDALLGEGGMGRVYSAEHVLMRKRLAVKVLHRELTTVPEVVARFEREAMAAANIDHPNVAAATDFGKLPNGSVFLVLEYVQGVSLRDQIAEGPMVPERALHIARQIGSALCTAHLLGIVHRDLKPENVMLVDRNGDPDFVKVLDFGIAKVPIQDISERGSVRPGQVITKVGMVFGTPEYMAPEQALGQDVDGRADVYALGVMLYEMLAGVRPFRSGSPVGILGQQLQGPPPSFEARSPGLNIPLQIEAAVLRLLAPNANDRVASAQDATREIEDLLGMMPKRRQLFTLAGGTPDEPSIRRSVADGEFPIGDPRRVSRPDAAALRVGSYSTIPAGPAPGDGRLARLWATALDATDRWRAKFPAAVQRPLQGVSSRSLLAGSVLAGLGLFGVVVGTTLVALRPPPAVVERHVAPGDSAPVVAERVSRVAPQDRAADTDISAARTEGLTALARLAARFPGDPAIPVESAKLQMNAGDSLGCVHSVERALSLDPRVNKNAEVATVLWKAVQRKESRDAAFALLEGAMSERGADILYDLTATPGVRGEIKQRAEQFFASKRYSQPASPALRVLIALRDADSCASRASLLETVTRDADARVLPLLAELRKTTGCGASRREDCYPCLRQGGALERAYSAIKQRTGH